MVPEGYRLRPLKMGISGENNVTVRLRLLGDRINKLTKKSDKLLGLISEIKSYIKRDLIVSASRGMQLFTRVAYSLCQLCLDEHMNVLTVHIELKASVLNVREYTAKSRDYFLAILSAYYPLLCQHRSVSDRARDILLIHSAVKAYRRIKIVRFFVERL